MLEGEKKRGRKQLRPNDPVKKKTEEKDKFWIRSFTACVRERPGDFIKLDPDFWNDFLSYECRPGKGKRFKSYGKEYKKFLFGNSSFATSFNSWFEVNAEQSLKKRHVPGSDSWFVFFDYAARELCNHYQVDCNKRSPEMSPRSPISDILVIEDFPIDHFN